ncbi:hypothetical protein R3P38DRAFT_2805961, partial [Favolaschia claudopus]
MSTLPLDSSRVLFVDNSVVLRIAKFGAAEENVKDVILSCAEVFGVNVANLTLLALHPEFTFNPHALAGSDHRPYERVSVEILWVLTLRQPTSSFAFDFASRCRLNPYLPPPSPIHTPPPNELYFFTICGFDGVSKLASSAARDTGNDGYGLEGTLALARVFVMRGTRHNVKSLKLDGAGDDFNTLNSPTFVPARHPRSVQPSLCLPPPPRCPPSSAPSNSFRRIWSYFFPSASPQVFRNVIAASLQSLHAIFEIQKRSIFHPLDCKYEVNSPQSIIENWSFPIPEERTLRVDNAYNSGSKLSTSIMSHFGRPD